MIPVIDRYEHQDVYYEGIHYLLFSHDDLAKVIKDLPYRRFTSGYVSGWVVEYPSRQDSVAAGWYQEEGFDWETAF